MQSEITYGVVTRQVLTGEPGLSFLNGLIEGRYPAPPFSRATSIYLTQAEEGRVVFSGMPTDAFFNPLGVIHGGWASALLDSAMGCAVHSTLKVGEGYTTVEMKLNFVRAILPSVGELTCEASVVHRGGTLATSEGRILDAQGRLYAHGTETCMIFKPGR